MGDFDPMRAIPGKPLLSIVDICAAQQKRIDTIETALRELEVMLHSVPLPGENHGPWNIKAKRIVHEALKGAG